MTDTTNWGADDTPIAAPNEIPQWGAGDTPIQAPQMDSEANKGLLTQSLDALKYGAGKEVSGVATTAKVLGGPDMTQSTQGLGTDGGTYTPAAQGLYDSTKTWRERLGFLPGSSLSPHRPWLALWLVVRWVPVSVVL